MNKRISGFGMIKSGVYENILVEGNGVALGDVKERMCYEERKG